MRVGTITGIEVAFSGVQRALKENVKPAAVVKDEPASAAGGIGIDYFRKFFGKGNAEEDEDEEL